MAASTKVPAVPDEEDKKDDKAPSEDDDKSSSEEKTSDDETSKKKDAADASDDNDSSEEKSPDEGEEEEGEPEEEDAASPEAIARRVAALGDDDDEIAAIAASEEAKLAVRKRAERGKMSGLEKSASKRLEKIGTKARPKREVATAIEAAEPTVERAMRAEEWAKAHQKSVWGVVGFVVVVALGWFGYAYMQRQKSLDASVALAQAVADEMARIGDPPKDDPDKPIDPGLSFKTYDERRESALAKYREVRSKYPATGAATLARLGEGSLLLDKRETDGAVTAFSDAKDSPLAKADGEVMGRALEGLGFAYEQKAQITPAERDKYLDEAVTEFKALENTDVVGFKELGMYHQARVAEQKGDVAKAKELLKALHERLNEPGQNHPLPYLQELTDDRLRRLDPSALPAKESGMLGNGPGGGKGLTPQQLKQLFGGGGKPGLK